MMMMICSAAFMYTVGDSRLDYHSSCTPSYEQFLQMTRASLLPCDATADRFASRWWWWWWWCYAERGYATV